jgi:predicted RNase H-like HicB family nuclease
VGPLGFEPLSFWDTYLKFSKQLTSVLNMMKKFNIVVERDEDGYYVASVPELPGCHTQAKTLDKLRVRIEEAIKLYLEVEKGAADVTTEFIGVQVVEVSV